MGWTHTIAPSGSTCPGTLPSKLGAAITTTSVVSRQSHRAQPTHTTVRMDSRIGRPVGQWPRRPGAVQTRAKGVHRQQEDVLDGLVAWSRCWPSCHLLAPRTSEAVTEPGHDDSSTGKHAIFGCCEHVPRFGFVDSVGFLARKHKK